MLTTGGSLNTPLGLAIAPDGDVLTVNGGDGQIVETSPVACRSRTSSSTPRAARPVPGALFGLAVAPGGRGVYFVDDATNFLRLLH